MNYNKLNAEAAVRIQLFFSTKTVDSQFHSSNFGENIVLS